MRNGHRRTHVFCQVLIFYYGGGQFNRICKRDNDGSILLWEPMLGKHENVIKILIDNGADVSLGDMSQFACLAVEQNDHALMYIKVESIADMGMSSCGRPFGSVVLRGAIGTWSMRWRMPTDLVGLAGPYRVLTWATKNKEGDPSGAKWKNQA